jgi:solute carrier family 31 (copper transporter), member 1
MEMDHSHHFGGEMAGGSGSGRGMHGGGMHMKGMPVAFEWGHRVTLYFDSWATETHFEYLVALLFMFSLCVMQEGLYYLRTLPPKVRAQTTEEIEGVTAPILPRPYKSPALRQRLMGTALYALNLCSSYLIMLAVMTCNGGVFFTVVLGLSVGHFLGKSRRPIATGHESSEACCIEGQ